MGVRCGSKIAPHRNFLSVCLQEVTAGLLSIKGCGQVSLMNALTAWKVESIPGIQSLVERTFAPAAVFAIFANQQPSSPDEQAM